MNLTCRVVPSASDLPPVPAIPSMYKAEGSGAASTLSTPVQRSRRDANDTGFSKIQEPQTSGFKKFMRRMTLQKPPPTVPDPAATSFSGPPRTPVPPAPKVAAAVPFVADSPTPSGRFGSLGRNQPKRRNSLVPQVQAPKSVKGVLAEMSQSSAQVQRRATQRRSQIQRIPVPSYKPEEPEPMITGNEKPAPPQTEVNANDESVTLARADALARLLGTKAAPSPSEADLQALPPLNLPLKGPMIGSTSRDTQGMSMSPIEDPPVSSASVRPRAPVPPLRTNSPRSMSSTPKTKGREPVTPPPEAMDVFAPPPPLPVQPEQLAKAPAPRSPMGVSLQSSPMKRVLIVESPEKETFASAAASRRSAAPSSFRNPLPDEFIQPHASTSTPNSTFHRTAPLNVKARQAGHAESPEPLLSPLETASYGFNGLPLPPGAGSPVSDGANLSDAAAIAASYRSRTTTPDRMRQRRPVAREASLPARKATGPFPVRSATGPASFGQSRSDLGHGGSTPDIHAWRVATSELGHGSVRPRRDSLPTRRSSARAMRSTTGPAAFGTSRSDLGHGMTTGVDEHGWPLVSASDSGHRSLRQARSQPTLRHVPSHSAVPPVPKKSALRNASSSGAMSDAAAMHQVALLKSFRSGRKAVSDLGHGQPPAPRAVSKSALGRGYRSAHGHASDDESDLDSDVGDTVRGSSVGHGSEHYSFLGHSSISHSTAFTHDSAFPGSPRSHRSPFAGSPAPYEAPIGDGLSSDGHGKPTRFRSISRTLSAKKKPAPNSFEAYEAKQRELLTRRKSCKPLIHSQASIAAEVRAVNDKEHARVMEACFMS